MTGIHRLAWDHVKAHSVTMKGTNPVSGVPFKMDQVLTKHGTFPNLEGLNKQSEGFYAGSKHRGQTRASRASSQRLQTCRGPSGRLPGGTGHIGPGVIPNNPQLQNSPSRRDMVNIRSMESMRCLSKSPWSTSIAFLISSNSHTAQAVLTRGFAEASLDPRTTTLEIADPNYRQPMRN